MVVVEPANKEPEFNINALTSVSSQSRTIAARTKTPKKHGFESGLLLLSLGIIDKEKDGKDGRRLVNFDDFISTVEDKGIASHLIRQRRAVR